MNKDEILAKSRAENKNKDVYEQEVLKQASRSAVVASMTINWVKYIKLHRKLELLIAIAYTILVSIMSGYYIYNLIVSSPIQ